MIWHIFGQWGYPEKHSYTSPRLNFFSSLPSFLFILLFSLLPTDLISQSSSLGNFPWFAFCFVLQTQAPHSFLNMNEIRMKKRYAPVNIQVPILGKMISFPALRNGWGGIQLGSFSLPNLTPS